MSNLNLHFFKRQPKSRQNSAWPLPGMVPNNAGGFAFEVNDWIKLRRFLVLGSEGGTYYVGEAKLTIENAQAVERLLRAEPIKVVRQIVEISKSGRSAKMMTVSLRWLWWQGWLVPMVERRLWRHCRRWHAPVRIFSHLWNMCSPFAAGAEASGERLHAGTKCSRLKN